jgi:hypothetical protein
MKRFTKHIAVFLCCIGSSSSAQNLGWVVVGSLEGSAKKIRQLSVKLDKKMTLYYCPYGRLDL